MTKPKESIFKYKSYTGATVIQKFVCLDCGCKSLYRHKFDYGRTFFEGHFHCINCKKEVDYCSDDFIRTEINNNIQLTLF